MKGNGQGFNRTAEGKLFKLTESNFDIGSSERLRRLQVKIRFDTVKLAAEFGSVIYTADTLKAGGY